MPIDVKELAMKGANVLTGGIMGGIMGEINDNRQYRNAARLQRLQIEGNMQMGEFNRNQAMKMWHDTGYSAQKKQMMEAGINPALMYGLGGGGGQTTQVQSGSVQGQSAVGQGREMQDMMGMSLQLELLKAQKENIQADTALKTADAVKTAGADTGLTESQTGLNKIKTNIEQMNLNVKRSTWQNEVERIVNETNKSFDEAALASTSATIAEKTMDDRVEMVARELLLKEMERQMMVSNISMNEARKEQIVADITQGWYGLSLEERKTRVMEARQEYDLEPSWDKFFNELISSTGGIVQGLAVGGALRRGGNKGTKTENILNNKGRIISSKTTPIK